MALTYKTTRARIAQLTEAVKDYTLLGMSPKGVPTEVYLSAILNYIPDISSEIANYISSDDLTELDAADNLSNNIAPSQRAVVSYVKTSGGINNAIVGCPGAIITSSSASTGKLNISLNDKDTSLRDTLSYEDFNKYRDSTLRLVTESQIEPTIDDQDLPYWGGFGGYMQQRQLHQGDIIKIPIYVTGYGVGYYWIVITEPIYRVTNTMTWSVVGRVINSQTDGGSAFSLESAKYVPIESIDATQGATIINVRPRDEGVSRKEFNSARIENINYRITIEGLNVFNSVEEGDLIYYKYRICDSSVAGNIYGTVYYKVLGKVAADIPNSTIYYLFAKAVFSVSDGNYGNHDPIFERELSESGWPALKYAYGRKVNGDIVWTEIPFTHSVLGVDYILIRDFNLIRCPSGFPNPTDTSIIDAEYKSFITSMNKDEGTEMSGIISRHEQINIGATVAGADQVAKCDLFVVPYAMENYVDPVNPIENDPRKRILFIPVAIDWTYRILPN